MPTLNTYNELQQLRKDVFTPQKKSSASSRLAIVVITVTVLFIIIASIFSVLTPQNTIVSQSQQFTTNIDGTTTKLTGIQFSGQDPQIPATLPLAKRSQSISSDTVSNKVIETYTLQPDEDIPDFWSKGNDSLNFDPSVNQFTLSLIEGYAPTEMSNLRKNEAIQNAQTGLQQLFPQFSLRPIESQIRYFELLSDHNDEAVTEDKATAANIPFAQYIGEYPIFNQRETQFPFFVTIDGNNRIIKITFSGTFHIFETLPQQSKTILLEQAFNNIKNGKAAIIDSTFGNTEIPLSSLDSAIFDTARVEYREDTTISLAYPFYHLSGKGVDKNGKELLIEVITPAVQTNVVN